MASSLTDFAEDKICNILRGTTATGITPYVALYTVAPTESTTGTECTGGSYARQAVTFNAPSAGVITNSGTVTFTTATASWGTVVAWAIMDASTAGNMWAFCDVASQTVDNGAVVDFLDTTLTITISHASLTNYFRDACLNIFRGTSVTGITPYVGLYTVAPTASTTGTECTGGSYARAAITYGAPSGGAITNGTQVDFVTPSAGWGTAVAHALSDASTAGNQLAFGAISPSLTINTGNSIYIAASGSTVTVA